MLFMWNNVDLQIIEERIIRLYTILVKFNITLKCFFFLSVAKTAIQNNLKLNIDWISYQGCLTNYNIILLLYNHLFLVPLDYVLFKLLD